MPDRKNFVILSPVWNARPWIDQCIDSVANQTYRAIRHIWIDDASTDGTVEILKRRIPSQNLILNSTRQFAAYNVWNALTHFVREDCLIGLLDGDDWLVDNTAVEQMADLHRQYDVIWSSHVVHENDRDGRPIVRSEGSNPLHRMRGDVRHLPWEPTHFFSFKRIHYLKIPSIDFQTDDGAWFGAMYDMALGVPLLEMAGWERCCYIDQAFYAYNRIRPESDDKERKELQQQIAALIKNRSSYSHSSKEVMS